MDSSAAPLSRTTALVRAGCVLMLAAGGAQALFTRLFRPEQFAGTAHWDLKWGLAYAVLVGAYAWSERDPRPGLTRLRIALFAAQSVAAQYLVWLYPSFLVTSMIVVVAWQVAWAASLRTALLAAGALAAVLVAQKCVDTTGSMSVIILISTCGFQLFAISAAHLAKSEAAARDRLMRANAELTATQALLTESARMSERLQISRDLHDVLGHNLTTLAIHLDVATRMTKGPAAKHLGHARDVAGALLTEVRDVVARVRVQPVDLRATLLALTDGLAGLEVRLELPDDLSAMDPARADAILRCVQELITNALRHAQARELMVALTQAVDGAVTITARDDGRGGAFVEGQGLTGMRERFEALGGSLSFASRQGEGFRMSGAIPAMGALP
jgi:signal transduction histidine kinase